MEKNERPSKSKMYREKMKIEIEKNNRNKMSELQKLQRVFSQRNIQSKEERQRRFLCQIKIIIEFGRIEEEYKKEISNIISYELKNPNITGLISVTKVKVTNDLKFAKVSISILNSKNIKETLSGLKKSSGFIRTELAKRVNLRNTPEIIFELDDSMEYGAKIDSILKDILKDVKKDNKEQKGINI